MENGFSVVQLKAFIKLKRSKQEDKAIHSKLWICCLHYSAANLASFCSLAGKDMEGHKGR